MLHTALIITSQREYAQALRHELLRLGDPPARIDVELDALRATQLATQQYELILLDAMLESIDGLQLLLLIKPQAPRCKFVIVSDTTDEATRALAYQNGADLFLERPTTAEAFRSALEALEALFNPPPVTGPTLSADADTVVAIADIVQMFCLSGDSVLLAVRSQYQSGDIFIYRGEVYHAQYPGKSGEAAFRDMLGWNGGLLRTRAIKLTHTPPRTIETPYRLLLETAPGSPEVTAESAPIDGELVVVEAATPSDTATLAVMKEAPPRDDAAPVYFPDPRRRTGGETPLPRVNSHWMVNLSGDLLEGSQVSEPDRCAFITSFIFRKMADVAVALEVDYFNHMTLYGPHLQQVLVADNMGVRHAVFDTAWTTEEMRTEYVKWCCEQSF